MRKLLEICALWTSKILPSSTSLIYLLLYHHKNYHYMYYCQFCLKKVKYKSSQHLLHIITIVVDCF